MKLIAHLPEGIRSCRSFGLTPPLLDLEKARTLMGATRDGRGKMEIAQGCLSLAKRLVVREPQRNSKNRLRHVINGSLARNLFLLAATSEGSQNGIDFVRPISDIDIVLVDKKLADLVANPDANVSELDALLPPLCVPNPTMEERAALIQNIQFNPNITIDRKAGATTDVCKLECEDDVLYLVAPWVLLAGYLEGGIYNHVNPDYTSSEFFILLNLLIERFGYPASIKLLSKYADIFDPDLETPTLHPSTSKFLSDIAVHSIH